MRDFKNMKRQRGRNRGGGGNGGGKPQQNANRAFDSNGPDNVKIRGHAQHVFEKYQQLARDAFSSGDRVLAENYLQHADHYFRLLRTIQPQRSPSEILGRDVLASGLDIDFEEEFEPGEETPADAASEGATEMNGEGGRGEYGRSDPNRNDSGRNDSGRNDSRGSRDDRYERNDTRREGYDYREPRRDDRYDNRRDNEGQSRDSSPREGQYRDNPSREGQSREGQPQNGQSQNGQFRDRGEGQNRSRSERQDGGDRQDRSERTDRFEGRRDNRRYEGRRDERPLTRDARDGRYDERRPAEPTSTTSDPMAVVAPEAAPFPVSAPEPEASPVLRSQDGAMSEAPAFLQAAPSEDGETRKPRARRRRAPKSFEGGEAEGAGEGAADPVVHTEDV